MIIIIVENRPPHVKNSGYTLERERERERESNVCLPKEGAFSVEVAETFMRCDTQDMWAFLFSNID